jgi:exopolysaccharide biosynthesis polyprenyl glycosylphosphotransferase
MTNILPAARFEPVRRMARLSPQVRSSQKSSRKTAKALLDVTIALFGLVLTLPLLVLCALWIKLDSKGPCFFRQKRHGLNGRTFTIYKFRTMHVLEDGDVVVQVKAGDCRVTRVGRLLRRTSLDELPQLLNVLRGDMSLVGPRPHAVVHDQYYSAVIPSYDARFTAKPGITGWAQVNGARGETPEVADMARRVELDLWYIEHWTLLLDFRILVRTIAHEIFLSNQAR